MNSRRIPEPAAEKKICAHPQPTSDHRPLVLLLIGLLVIAVHLAGRNAPKAAPDQAADSLVWLAGSTLQDGVYSVNPRLLPPITHDLGGLYRVVGLTPPAVSDLAAEEISGLRLENGRPPAVISPPAVFNSLLFLPIPVNEADRELLTTVPGIGPHLAEQILGLRCEKKQLNGPEDLLALPGIGRGRLQQLAAHLSFRQSGR
jgi:hypothetical protein